MNESSRIKLQSILSSMEMEANKVAIDLEESHKRINNLEKEVKQISNSFSENDVIFSPRKDKFPQEELRQKKELLKEENRKNEEIKKQYEELNNNMDMIVDVLSHENDMITNKSGLLFHEQDRQRIARDLHEVAVQNLSFLVERLESCIANIDRDPIKVKMDLSMAKNSLASTIDNIRSVVYDLRPIEFEIDNFKNEIQKFVNEFNKNDQFKIEMDIDEIICDDQMILRTVYQIIEESFQNIKKHADAYSIHLIVQEQIGLLYIYVEDDGKGFDLNKVSKDRGLHFGLSIMKEKVSLLGGNISIITSENAGTKIKILIPFSAK